MTPLHDWIAAQGARVRVASAVDPVSAHSSTECGDGDRTIYAVGTIAEGEVLVALRDGAFLNGDGWLRATEASSSDEGAALRKEITERQPCGTVRTAMALLSEKARGEASSFYGYISQLPARIPLPMTWGADARRLLTHTAANPIIDYDLVQNVFRHSVAPLTAMFPTVWPKEVASLDAFKWAYSVVSSRAFSIDGAQDPTLLPVIDMANHDQSAPNAIIHKDEAQNYSLVALRSISKGEPVTISYGDLSNAQLLCRYGFVLPGVVPSDTILLSSDSLRAAYAHLTSGGSVDDALKQLDMLAASGAAATEAAAAATSEQRLAKRRKLFDESPSDSSDSLLFALHGNPADEFGISDTLLSFVFANHLSAELIDDVLTVLLQRQDKLYSVLLATDSVAEPTDEATRLVRSLVAHERHVCRRILLGIMSLEENSDEGDDEELGSDEDGPNSEQEEEEDDDEGEERC